MIEIILRKKYKIKNNFDRVKVGDIGILENFDKNKCIVYFADKFTYIECNLIAFRDMFENV